MWGWANPAITSALFRLDRQTRQPLVHVVNAAKAGRSARTYLEEGRWEQVYNSLRPGDYVVLQFGHNDMGDIAGGKARADIAGVADSSHVYRLKSDFSYKVVYTYGWYLRKFVRDAREKGAIPIICSMTPRNEWSSERHYAEKHTKSGIYIERRPGSAATWAAEVAAELDVPFVDIHNLTADYLDRHCSARSPEASKAKANAYYSHDHTHTSLKGARLNASMFAAGLRQTTCPLKDLLK
jgi:lysophospholipase L1-like esterase